MAPEASDAQLWICVAILGWCSALAIHKQLTLIRNVSEVAETVPLPPKKFKQQAQDGTILSHSQSQDMAKKAASAIELSTLSELLQSTSPEIRDATTRIIVERALQSPTVWRVLRRQLRSKTDFKARNQALSIIVQFGPGSVYDMRMRSEDSRKIEYIEFFHPATFKACVACLCNMLPAAREAERLRQHHDSAEADALWFMHKLLENDIALALEAGLVRKWLVNYPLTVRHPEKTKSEIIGGMLRNFEYDDDYERLLCCVLYDMMTKAEVDAELLSRGIVIPLETYNLLKYGVGRDWGARHHYTPSASERRFGGNEDYRGDVEDVRDRRILVPMYTEPTSFQRTDNTLEARNEQLSTRELRSLDGELERNFLDEAASLLGRGERVVRRREESDEERALRSRRREAMVFAEGGGPIRQEDIIESRREEITDEEVEEELEQLIEEVEKQEERTADERVDNNYRTWVEYLTALRPDGSVRR